MGHLQLLVDNRVRMRLEALDAHADPACVEKLLAAFEHHNPTYSKNVAMFGHPRGEPKKLITWSRTKTEVNFPRGGLQRLRILLEAAGIEVRTKDARTPGSLDYGDRPVPAHKPPGGGDLWPHQAEAVDALLARENALLRAGTGCLAGSTIIGLNRAGKGFELELSELVRRFNGGATGGRVWRKTIQTLVRFRAEDGYVRLGQLSAAYESGVKMVYLLRTESGRSIKATADHRFLTDRGWYSLGNLRLGDKVYVERYPVKSDAKAPKKKPCYRMVTGLRYHPHAGRRDIKGRVGFSVLKHRLVAEAALNKVSLIEFVWHCRSGPTNFTFLDPEKWSVHHLDENILNNTIGNLAVMTRTEHLSHHAKTEGWKHVAAKTVLDEVVGIEKLGEEMTYDLAMLNEPHNFIANGMVVHNSGKTSCALAIASRVGVPTMVIVPSAPLFEQWVARAGTELGLKGDQLGIIKGPKRRLRPLTIALRHSLAGKVTDEMKQYFGCIVIDEVQAAPANSCFEIIDEFPARYRFGISADEARKDRKECLTYDLFGDVAYEISREQCIDKGITIEVEMRVVLTDFDAPWYRGDAGDFQTDAVSADPNFTRLVEEIIHDKDRNELVARIVRHEVLTAGEQAVVLTRRREHATALDVRFVSMGIRSGLVMGGDDYRTVREETLGGLGSGTIRVGVGTLDAIGTGVDMPAVSVGVMATPISKNKQLLGQVWGRFCRKPKGKISARLYYLLDQKVFSLAPLRAMVRDYRRVLVLHRGQWIPAKDYLQGARTRSTSARHHQ